MESHGQLTAAIANHLANLLKPRGYDVIHDHGSAGPNVGRIISWFGAGSSPHRANEMSQLDIAVLQRSSGRVLALIEIEETNDRPKNILGDVFGTLMGDHITFQGKPLSLGDWTRLIVLGIGDEENAIRAAYMERLASACKQTLTSANAVIGRLFLESLPDGSQLESRLTALVEKTIRDTGAAT